MFLPLQAFINTARKIYEKIEQGVFDVTNEVSLMPHAHSPPPKVGMTLCSTVIAVWFCPLFCYFGRNACEIAADDDMKGLGRYSAMVVCFCSPMGSRSAMVLVEGALQVQSALAKPRQPRNQALAASCTTNVYHHKAYL